MRVDLRYAALSQDTERRVRLAASALAAHQIKAAATEWDGTRCDFVLADASDTYGQHVIEIARRKGFGVFAFGDRTDTAADGVIWLHTHTNVATLAGALRDALIARQSSGHPKTPAHGNPDATDTARPETQDHVVANAGPAQWSSDTAGLVRLATDRTLMQQDLEATVHGRTIHLLPSAGRVLATSLSDLLGARERLCDGGWTFAPLSAKRNTLPAGEVSAGLDVFYLYGAMRGRQHLPPIPAVRYGLRDWPDLGTAPDLIDALRVVRALQRVNVAPSEIAAICSVPEADVVACLWAFSAAGLLTRNDQEPAPAVPTIVPAKPPSGLMGRLAAHFGLRLT